VPSHCCTFVTGLYCYYGISGKRCLRHVAAVQLVVCTSYPYMLLYSKVLYCAPYPLSPTVSFCGWQLTRGVYGELGAVPGAAPGSTATPSSPKASLRLAVEAASPMVRMHTVLYCTALYSIALYCCLIVLPMGARPLVKHGAVVT